VALTESVEIDKVEIVGPYKAVQVRTATVIYRDDEEISRSFHRHVVSAGDDYSNETSEVQGICAAVHTDAVVAAKQAADAANQPPAGVEE